MTLIGNWLINSYWPQVTLAPDSLVALFFFFFLKPGTKKTRGCFPLTEESHSSVLFQLETAYSEHYLKPSHTEFKHLRMLYLMMRWVYLYCLWTQKQWAYLCVISSSTIGPCHGRYVLWFPGHTVYLSNQTFITAESFVTSHPCSFIFSVFCFEMLQWNGLTRFYFVSLDL